MNDLETWKARSIQAVIESAVFGIFVTALFIVASDPDVGAADATAAAQSSGAEIYHRLRPFPAPFTQDEKRSVRAALADARTSLARVREATDEEVARLEGLSRAR